MSKSDEEKIENIEKIEKKNDYSLTKNTFISNEDSFKKINFFLKSQNMYFYACIIGAISHPVLYLLGFKVGQEGVAYYGEVHQQSWNCYMHTLGMPFTIYGMQLWIPAILTNNIVDANKLQKSLYLGYLTHYGLINTKIASIYIPFYGLPTYSAIQKYKNTDITFEKNRFNLFCYGFMISFLALLFQEVAGHWYGGDEPSRFEAIFNAILYAKYFSISHMIY